MASERADCQNSNFGGPSVSAKKLEDEDGEAKSMYFLLVFVVNACLTLFLVPKVDRNVAAAIARARAAKEMNQKKN